MLCKVAPWNRFFSSFTLLIIIPPLIDIQLRVLHEVCNSHDQAAHYYTVGLWGFISDLKLRKSCSKGSFYVIINSTALYRNIKQIQDTEINFLL